MCILKKALYGLKEAPRAWYSRLDKYLQKKGFKKGGVDINLYIKANENELLIVVVYVDDIMFGSKKYGLAKGFAEEMKSEFEMSMIGEITFYLGLQIQQKNTGIFISQEKYLREMLKRFQMEDCKPLSTPMIIGGKLCANDGSIDVDQKRYRSMIGILLYLTASRPDIMLAVGLVPRYQAAPKQNHLLAVKRIFRYLQGTTQYGLWYPKGKSFTLIAYTDADWASCVDDRKSTSGGAFYLGESLVARLSKKQTSISLSTAEAEYIAAATCCTQVMWMKQTLQDMKVSIDEPISIKCDNTSAISISKNPVLHSKTKYHFLREQVAQKIVKLEYVPTKEQTDDIFTKPLAREPFEYLRDRLGVVSVDAIL